jgi:chromate transporter
VNTPREPRTAGHLADVVRLFLRMGFTSFGGPAAHNAMMRNEVVTRRGWLTDQEFLDLLGATNLIPGPNSTELAIHIGYRQAGWRGLVAAGTAFIVPAVLIVTVLAWAYVRYGTTPEATWLFYGIKPVIIAIVVQALWGLGRTAIRDVLTAGVGLGAVVLYFIGVNEIALLLAAGLTVVLLRNVRGAPRGLSGVAIALAAAAPAVITAVPFTLDRLFLIFVKIGSVLYGSGYVLLAFLHGDFVERLRWLTDRQLLDAIAIGQFTPGPVFTTATFIGYLLGGLPGALLATAGIFLPAFVFVAASHPLIPRMRRSAWTAALLDGVNVASLALMAGVAWHLGRSAIVDPLTAVVALAAFGLLVRVKVNSAWLVMGGAALGVIVRALGR